MSCVIMIQQPGSSLLLMKLLEFVVSGVTEMTNPPGCVERFRPQGAGEKWEGNPEILSSQLCQVLCSDLYFQNSESSALE